MLLSHICSGQIQYLEFGEVFTEDVMFVEDTGPHELLEDIKDPSMQKIMIGFRNTDIHSIKAFLSPKLSAEVASIDSLLDTYEKKFNSVDSVYLYENTGYAFGRTGTIGLTKFSHRKIGDVSIRYQYISPKGKSVINEISIEDTVFPSQLSLCSKLKSKIKSKDLSFQEKYDASTELLALISIKEGEEYNDFYIPESKSDLSDYNGSLSWYALNIGENETAVSAAQKGLELNPSNTWINTNLALGLAQSGKLDEALVIYKKLMNEPYRNTTYKDVFLKDIEDVEANGIKIKYKNKIIKALTSE